MIPVLSIPSIHPLACRGVNRCQIQACFQDHLFQTRKKNLRQTERGSINGYGREGIVALIDATLGAASADKQGQGTCSSLCPVTAESPRISSSSVSFLFFFLFWRASIRLPGPDPQCRQVPHWRVFFFATNDVFLLLFWSRKVMFCSAHVIS
jgi:hypothetical protein